MAHFPWSAPDQLTGTLRGLSLALCLLLATVAAPLLTASPGTQGASTQSDAIALATRDFEDTVARGDAFASAGDYFEAVLAFERAKRVAYNNKLKIDEAALSRKLDAARKARDTKTAAPKELLPPPPPPVAGFQASLSPRMPDYPGKFRPWRFVNMSPEGPLRPTPAEIKAMEASLQQVVDILRKVPMLNPPTGFEMEFGGSASSTDVPGRPLRGDVSFGAYGYFKEQVRVKATGELLTRAALGDETNGAHIELNELPEPFGWDDAQGRMFLEPVKQGEIGGFPVYDNTLYVLRPGDAMFARVTMERFIKAWTAELRKQLDTAEAVVAGRRRQAEEELSPATQERRRQEIEAERAKGGSGVDQNVRRLEAKHKRWADDARKALESAEQDPKYLGPLQAYKDVQARAAALDAAGREAEPCLLNATGYDTWTWTIVPVGTTGCRRVVQTNFDLFRRTLPRSAVQVISVPQVTNCSYMLETDKSAREDPGGCLAVVRILRSLDWQQLAGLLQK
jgi:hypothetical protein